MTTYLAHRVALAALTAYHLLLLGGVLPCAKLHRQHHLRALLWVWLGRLEDVTISDKTVRSPFDRADLSFAQLYFAALLRLPRQMTKAAKLERVSTVITALGLDKCKNTIIGALHSSAY